MSTKTPAPNAARFSHLLKAPREALIAMTQGLMIAPVPDALVEALARERARDIIEAARRAHIA